MEKTKFAILLRVSVSVAKVTQLHQRIFTTLITTLKVRSPDTDR